MYYYGSNEKLALEEKAFKELKNYVDFHDDLFILDTKDSILIPEQTEVSVTDENQE